MNTEPVYIVTNPCPAAPLTSHDYGRDHLIVDRDVYGKPAGIEFMPRQPLAPDPPAELKATMARLRSNSQEYWFSIDHKPDAAKDVDELLNVVDDLLIDVESDRQLLEYAWRQHGKLERYIRNLAVAWSMDPDRLIASIVQDEQPPITQDAPNGSLFRPEVQRVDQEDFQAEDVQGQEACTDRVILQTSVPGLRLEDGAQEI